MNNSIKKVRESLELDADALAARAGISPRLERAVENCECVAPVDVAIRLARELGLTVEELFEPSADSEPLPPEESLPETTPDNDPEMKKSDAVDPSPEEPVGESAPEQTSGARKKKRATAKKPRASKKKTEPENSDAPEPESHVPEGAPIPTDAQAPAEDAPVSEPIAPEQYVPTPSEPTNGSLLAARGEPLFIAADVARGLSPHEALRRVWAPQGGAKISSYSAKVADADGLAVAPEGMTDPTEGRSIRYFDLFCGIGGFRYAFMRTAEKMGRSGECVLSCDIDRFVQKSYEANFGEVPVSDVSKLSSDDIPDFDLLFAGFPCQTFSIIGLRRGFEDETKGSLFFQIARILRDKRPRAFILENVRQLVTHDGGRTFEIILRVLQDELGYCVDWRVMNALDCGLPQKRERVIIVGSTERFDMEWPVKAPVAKTLEDILIPDRDVPFEYFASTKIMTARRKSHKAKFRPAVWHENKSGSISSYPYSCALRAGASYNYLLVNGERRFMPIELLRLQGFPDDFKVVVSENQIRRQTGNAVPVDLVARAMERFLPLVFRSSPAEGVK